MPSRQEITDLIVRIDDIPKTMNKNFDVGVFGHARDGGKKTRYLAYTMWFNPSWAGCCIHRVRAANSKEAKAMAIAEHKKKCNIKAPGA